MYRTCSKYGEMRNTYRILVEKPRCKRSVGRLRYRSDNSVKDAECEGMDWVQLAQVGSNGLYLVNAVTNH